MRIEDGLRPAPPVTTDVDSLGLCPYSEETVAGCRHYTPVSEHGDFPGAGHCKEAFTLSGTDHIRYILCGRRSGGAAQLPRAQEAHQL